MNNSRITIVNEIIVDNPKNYQNEIKNSPIQITVYGNKQDRLINAILTYAKRSENVPTTHESKLIENVNTDESSSDESSSDEEEVPKKKASINTKKYPPTSNKNRKIPKTTNRGTSKWHNFVSKNYNKIKQELGLTQAQDIMKVLSARWKEEKKRQK